MAIFPETATSHQQVSAWRTGVYREGIRDGSFSPFVLPLFYAGSGLVLLYLLVPAIKGRLARLAVFGANVAFQLWIMRNCRSSNPSGGLVVGMLSGWSILWSAVLLIFTDARKRFKKVQHVRQAADGSAKSNGHVAANGSAKSYSSSPANGPVQSPSKSPAPYRWQSLPNNFIERLGWATDLVFNFRGIGWDWKVSGMPSRPSQIEASLRGIDLSQATQEDRPVTSTGRVRFETRTQVLLHHAKLAIVGFLVLDALRTMVSHDAYFWGIIHAPPPIYMPSLVTSSPILVGVYRRTVILAFIYLALQTAFALVPLILIAFPPSLTGCNGEAWMYPDQFGDYRVVFSRGVAGFWGGWWHQIFRYGFQSGGRWLASHVLGLKPKSQVATVIELYTSFALSGLLHAAASITMIGDTRPWTKMFWFFIMQPTGIILEIVAAYYIGKSSVGRRMPKYVGWFGHFTYAHLWLYFTLPFLADELVRGGLLLSEPVPYSPLRGLGLGAPGDGFHCWSDVNTSWRWGGKQWWTTGLSI